MKIFEVKLVLCWQLINYGPSLWVWMTEHPTFLHSYSKAESSWKYSPGSELPLPLKIRWLSSLGTEAQLNKLLQNGIFAFKWNVKHSYTVVEEPGLAGRSAAYCMQNVRDQMEKGSQAEKLSCPGTDEPHQCNFPQCCCHSAPPSPGQGTSSQGFAWQRNDSDTKGGSFTFCCWANC